MKFYADMFAELFRYMGLRYQNRIELISALVFRLLRYFFDFDNFLVEFEYLSTSKIKD